MASKNIYTVRPDQTQDGFRDYDTVSGIAQEWMEQNPQSKLSLEQVAAQIIKANGLKTRDGVECDTKHIQDAMIHVGQHLVLPAGNAVVSPRQHREECPTVVPEAAPDMPLSIAPTPVAREVEVDFRGKAKLPEYPATGTVGNSAIYSAINAPMLLGKMPEQPDWAARGKNPNHTGIQTPGDVVRPLVDAAIKATGSLATGGAMIVLPFHLATPDSAEYAQIAAQGSNGKTENAQSANNAWTSNMYNQWPLNGAVNPFANGDKDFHDATLLPAVGVVVDKNGAIQHAAGTEYANNHVYTTHGGVPAVTMSRVGVESNFKDKNTFGDFGKPSAPVELVGTNNYAMAHYVDATSIQPQIMAAAKLAQTNPTQENYQHLVELNNYRGTLVGASNYHVNADVTQIRPEQVGSLNPAELIAYQTNLFVKAAETKGFNVDADRLPAETPIHSVPKAQMRENLVGYYEQMAKEMPASFGRVYGDIVGEGNAYMGVPSDHKQAAQTFVEKLPFFQSYPENGVPLKELDQFVSTRDPHDPTNRHKDNFNLVEKGAVTPRVTTKESQTAAMQVIADNPELTATLLESAGSNRKLAEALAQRDRMAMDLPAEFGDHSIALARTAEDAKARGYSERQLESSFSSGIGQGIVRGDYAGIQQDLAQSANNPDIVKLRQEDLRSLATDGSEKIGAFPVGSLQTQLLYSLATEKDNATLSKLEEKIRATAASPVEAEKQIDQLHAGVTAAANAKGSQIVGTPYDNLKQYVGAGQVASAARTGTVPLESGTHTVESGKAIDSLHATNVMSKIASHEAAPEAFLAGVANHGQEQDKERVLDAASSLPKAARIAAAQAALAGVTLAGGEGTDVLGGKNPARMNANDAAQVLQALKAGDAETPAVAGLAKDARTAQAVAQQLADTASPTEIASMVKHLGEDASKVSVRANLDRHTDLVFDPQRSETRNVTVTADATSQPFVDAGKSAAAGSEQQAAALVKTFLNDRTTTSVAMEQLTNRTPEYAAALVLQTLNNKPELMSSVGEALEASDSEFLGGKKSELAGILTNLADARKENDPEAAKEYAAELATFANHNPATMHSLVSATLAAPNGRAAFLNTLNSTLENAEQGMTQPLETSSYNNKQSLAVLYKAVVQADPAHAADLSAHGQHILNHLPVVPSAILPGIAFPNPFHEDPTEHRSNTPKPKPIKPEPVPVCNQTGPGANCVPPTPEPPVEPLPPQPPVPPQPPAPPPPPVDPKVPEVPVPDCTTTGTCPVPPTPQPPAPPPVPPQPPAPPPPPVDPKVPEVPVPDCTTTGTCPVPPTPQPPAPPPVPPQPPAPPPPPVEPKIPEVPVGNCITTNTCGVPPQPPVNPPVEPPPVPPQPPVEPPTVPRLPCINASPDDPGSICALPSAVGKAASIFSGR